MAALGIGTSSTISSMPGGGWAHSCCSAAALAAALSDPSVHSIESDILVSSRTGQPVMAHPPATDSDLSFDDFLVACTGGDDGRKRKHLKFDFKDAAAVGPCLEHEFEDMVLSISKSVIRRYSRLEILLKPLHLNPLKHTSRLVVVMRSPGIKTQRNETNDPRTAPDFRFPICM